MADTDMPSSSSSDVDDDNSSIDEHHHPVSAAETCKKPKMAATTTTIRDFISGLPDAILCDILSYIPTKHAVATSVLSKRWNRVWTSVPNLDFSDFSRYSSRTPVTKTHFLNFVDRVLSLNTVSRVRKIYVECNDDECDSLRVNAWISAIITRDAEEFSLRLPRSYLIESLESPINYSLPDGFFTRKNLVELKLENIAIKVPTLVDFPNLNTICFDVVQLLDDDSMKNLLSGCPILRSLSIDRVAWDNVQTLYICSSTLHYLRLHTGHCDKDFGYKVVIEAPSLTTLYLGDEVDADYDIINLSSLVRAHICIEQDGRVQPDGEVFNDRLFELLRKISHIEELCIDTDTMRSFEYAPLENLPMFNNLTHLEVEIFLDDSWPILPYLFHCTPNLVTFVLGKDNVHPHCGWCEPSQVPQCFLSSIEDVEISNFEECDDEMEMVYYFLKNAMVLKTMSISSYKLDLKKETNILKLLMLMPRSSSICQVKYENARMW